VAVVRHITQCRPSGFGLQEVIQFYLGHRGKENGREECKGKGWGIPIQQRVLFSTEYV
jgi:hypothetical protein